jgi:hypothetical protein
MDLAARRDSAKDTVLRILNARSDVPLVIPGALDGVNAEWADTTRRSRNGGEHSSVSRITDFASS